ncbi:MAG: carboxypeptidase-like regulatory domain-containing protein [Acidobacteriota bacterium]|nr:carboxypeptidase-like regulatory domain-containing protein [Acidobacteriota bacterium]
MSVFRDRPGSLLGTAELLVSRSIRATPNVTVVLSDLEPGPARLVCESSVDGLYRQQAVNIVADREITVAFTFMPTNIEGRVWRGKETAEGVSVRIARDFHGTTTLSDVDGKYALRVWSSGDFICVATPPGKSPYSEVLIVEPDTTALEHDIRLPANSIVGTIRETDSGQTIPGATVYSRPAEERHGRTQVNAHLVRKSEADGTYRIDNLEVRALDLTFSAPDHAPRDFHAIVPAEEGTTLDVSLDRGGILRGRVVDDVGRPMAGAFVGLDPEAKDFRERTDTSTAGEFEFREVGRGAHRIVVHKCGYRVEASTVAHDERGDPTLISLSRPVGPVTLHFEDSRGNPVARVGISVAANGVAFPEEFPSRFALQCGTSPFSDVEGNLKYDLLPAGALAVYSEPRHDFLGVFANDGSQPTWRIEIPTPPVSRPDERQKRKQGRDAGNVAVRNGAGSTQ